VVVLPHGLYYGRVDPDDTATLLSEHAAGRIDLERYRGRSAFSFPVQAAERAIRESERLLGIDDLTFLGSSSLGPDTVRVCFRTSDGAMHEVQVEKTHADEPAYLTCESAAPKLARRYAVTAHHVSR
jgi:hypothetical protein